MTRTLPTDVATAIAAPTYRQVFFASFAFDEGTERACTAPFSIWFDDTGCGTPNEFVGVGTLVSISAIEEGSELRSYGMSTTLSGVDPAQIGVALDSHYQGRQATIWLGFLDADHVLIATPVQVFSGIMDTMPVEIGTTATITLTIENALARWEKPNPQNQRYTDADQQAIYPGDLFFSFVSSSATKELKWGRA